VTASAAAVAVTPGRRPGVQWLSSLIQIAISSGDEIRI